MPDSVSPSDRSGFLPLDTTFEPNFESDLGQLLLTGDPFDDQISNQLGQVDFTAAPSQPLEFGSADTFKFGLTANAGFSSSLLLKRADGENLGPLDDYLPADIDYTQSLLIALNAEVTAGVQADASAKVGAYLGLSGGAEASGGVGYHRCKAYPRNTPARKIMADFLGSLRWPLSDPGAAPVGLLPTDLCAAEFRGKLKLWGELSLGYSVSGSQGIDLDRLDALLNYKIDAALRWGGSFEMGGSYRIVSSGGASADWVRLRAHRTSRRAREAHFGFDLTIDTEVTGLPESPEGLFTALTGLDTTTALKWLETAAETTDITAALKAVRDKYGKQAEQAFTDLFSGLLDDVHFDELKTKVAAIIEKYTALKDGIDQRVFDLARKHIKTEEVKTWLQTALDHTTREALTQISDGKVWALIDDLAGDKAYALLTDQSAFTAFRTKAQKLLDILNGKGDFKPLHKFIVELEERFNVDTLIEKLNDGLDREKLTELAKGKFAGLLDRIFDVTAKKLKGSDADKIVQRVSRTAQDLLAFKKKLAERLEKGLKNKLEFSLLQTSATENSTDALVDMEFNLATAEGRRLCGLARRGDFLEAMKAATRSTDVRIREGKFQQALTSSRSLTIHALGWQNAFEVKVEQLATAEAVMQEGGPVFLLSSETTQTMRRVSGYKQPETVQSVLQLGVQARSAVGLGGGKDELLVRVIEETRCNCSILHEQSNPAWGKLARVFRLARQLNLVADPESVVQALRDEFGDTPLKSVSLNYSIAYNPAAFVALWKCQFGENSPERHFLSQTFRNLLLDRWEVDEPGFFRDENEAHYLNHVRIERSAHRGGGHRSPGQKNRYKIITRTNGAEETHLVWMPTDVLYRAYLAEKLFLEAIQRIDDAIQRAQEGTSSWQALNADIASFLAVPKNKYAFSPRVWKGNLFFLALDAILQRVDPGARAGKTVLQLDFTPATGDPVRRFFPHDLTA